MNANRTQRKTVSFDGTCRSPNRVFSGKGQGPSLAHPIRVDLRSFAVLNCKKTAQRSPFRWLKPVRDYLKP